MLPRGAVKFKERLIAGRLLRRYKRFLADVVLDNGMTLTVHCPNSGSMRGCLAPDSPVLLSRSDNPKRKYPHTLEMLRVRDNWVGVNTGRANTLVREALERDIIREIPRVEAVRPEIRVSSESRLDFLVRHDGDKALYIEVKNCTLVEDEAALFPDAVTRRGAKHLQELLNLKEAGHGACVLFCVQRADADRFAPAAHIDPWYAELLTLARRQGVLVLAYQAEVRPDRIQLVRGLPVMLP